MRKFVVVVPGYNNRQWYARNLGSIFAQHYAGGFRVIYIDDASSDGTGELVQEYIAERNSEPLVTLTRNPFRMGALQNLYNAISLCGRRRNRDTFGWRRLARTSRGAGQA